MPSLSAIATVIRDRERIIMTAISKPIVLDDVEGPTWRRADRRQPGGAIGPVVARMRDAGPRLGIRLNREPRGLIYAAVDRAPMTV